MTGWLTTEQAAERLGIGAKYLRKAIKSGAIPLTVHRARAYRAKVKFWFREADVNRVAFQRRTLYS